MQGWVNAKKVDGFRTDGSIEKNEDEITSSWTFNLKKILASMWIREIKKSSGIKDCDLVHLHNPVVEGVVGEKEKNHV